MPIQLESPHQFAERILLFGGGGVGKTNTPLNIMSHMAHGEMYVIESDYSLAYERALATDFQDIEHRVQVFAPGPDWTPFIEAFESCVSTGDPNVDWITVDPVGGSYDWVQEWSLDQQYGRDLPSVMVELKKQYGADAKAYAAALSDMINWNLVKKEYSRFWKAIQKWKGNLILVAEAKAVRNNEKDDETKMLYGPLGFQPVGHATLKHVASTTLFLDHPKRGQWRMTTIKDRNREEMDKEPVDDFGIDYLQQVAGWSVARKTKS